MNHKDKVREIIEDLVDRRRYGEKGTEVEVEYIDKALTEIDKVYAEKYIEIIKLYGEGQNLREDLEEIVKQRYLSKLLSVEEITNILKQVQFKQFIPENGVRGTDKVTAHFKARKRFAKAIHQAMKGAGRDE